MRGLDAVYDALRSEPHGFVGTREGAPDAGHTDEASGVHTRVTHP